MAIPKVFVSSTCYDLAEERAQLERFITNYGFQPVLSEYSGVFYNPDIHTHEACIKEVEHCDIFVLLIAGRFGGKNKDGEGESITQAEHNRARELGLPIFSFAKASINDAQHCYKKNVADNGEEFANQITYPAIPKASDAIPIFKFMDSVHRSDKNNGIETYYSFSDIESHLKKQWAGMFFSFLQKRKEEDKVEAIATVLDKLAGSSSKLEALIGSLHDKEVGPDQTAALIAQSKVRKNGLNFFGLLLSSLANHYVAFCDQGEQIESEFKVSLEQLTNAAKVPSLNNDMVEYLEKTGLFDVGGFDLDKDLIITMIDDASGKYMTEKEADELFKMYTQGIQFADEQMRLSILKESFSDYID
ncbi:DUF4062 domain-containing protein [Vibrio splendidus]|uniref:DUF4062 domain-containing protein n=1 Tax=Vibrio splendidus TaxID=29497 RepID=UPI000D3B1091|nr:DUF4062 domain-containing protein [Vibrio splendidus]PTP30769.1 hypothetical protein CWN92_08780 [Vibrio splendidus]